MKEARLYVDFNELIDSDLVLLSQTDFKKDSKGNTVVLKEGMRIKIYSDDRNEKNEPDNLIAEGSVELNQSGVYKNCKWICRIDKNGIRHASDLK